jgi:hypothetical protein
VVAVDRNAVSVLSGNGDGTFAAPAEFGAGVGPLSVAIADFDGDGRPISPPPTSSRTPSPCC